MAVIAPTPIDAGPAVPSSADSETTFDSAYEAFNAWEKNQLQPQANALASNVFNNAQEAVTAANTAIAEADAALGYRNTANSAATTATNAASTATTKAAEAEASAVQASKLNLGAKASAPTVDNQGAALLTGATYFDTTLGKWRAWNGAAWVDPVSVTAGVTSINGQSGALTIQYGLLNKIINGNFGINRRAYVSGATTTAGQYTLDRWKVTGTGGVTFSTTNNKTTVTIPSGQTVQQVIEGLNLESGAYVLSWEGTAQGRINGGAYGASGTVTATITGGANTTIEFNAGTVALVMFEKSSVATPFEHRPYGVEWALCQRYLPVVYAGSPMNGMAISTTVAYMNAAFHTPPRVAPTGIISGSSGVLYQSNGVSVAITGVTWAGASGLSGATLQFSGASGLAAGNGTFGFANSNILFTGCEL